MLFILVGIVIRILYSFYNPAIILRPDTYGYYELSQQIFSSKFFTYFINESRGPIYPIFMQLILFLGGYFNVSVNSAQFYRGSQLIIFTQSIVGLLTLVIIYLIAFRLKIKDLYAYVFTLLMGCNILLIQWERELLTETLGIFSLLLTIYFSLIYLKSAKNIYLLLLSIMFTISFLVRPIFVALPFLLIPIIFYYHRQNMKSGKSLLLLFTHILIIMMIIRHNMVNFGYQGITRTFDLALMGKILHYQLPIGKAKYSQYFYENMTSYRKINGDPNPFRFIEYYDHDIYSKNYRFNEMKIFNFAVISSNLPQFFYKSAKDLPNAMVETADIKPLNPSRKDFLGFIFENIYFFYKNLLLLTFVILPMFPLTVYKYIKHASYENTAWMIIGSISIYQLITSVFLDYEDFGRLIVVAQPLIYLFTFYWWIKIIQWFKVPLFFNYLIHKNKR